MSADRPENPPPVEAFLEQFWKDRETGHARGLSEYFGLFPGDDRGIALEYVALIGGGPSGNGERPPDADCNADPDLIGPYRTLQVLGQGGQGVVYLAQDTRLPRKVALKVLSETGFLSEEGMRRFRREAEIASRLDHPGICAVHDAGVDLGTAWIAMRLVEGEPLSRKITTAREGTGAPKSTTIQLLANAGAPEPAEGPRTPATAPDTEREVGSVLLLIEKAAQALHSAHEAGVIHRDIKPGNIMVTPEGEPVILDFGLARELDGEGATMTMTGALFGTPAYMSPEQLLAHRVRLDRRTDVYSLGVTLYECLTLRRPFDAPTREGLYQAIQTKDAPDPRPLNRAISADLRVVIETAIEKDRDRRYQSAAAFAEDLRRVRMLEPILARPIGPFGRLVRWAQRNPAVAALSSALLVALISGLVVSLVLYADAGAERDRANVKTAEATKNLDAYNRLADARILEDLLRDQEEKLWPAVPDKVPAMEDWLTRARALAKTLPDHEATLADLRTLALPYTDGARARDRASHKMGLEALSALGDEIRQALDVPEARTDQRKKELEEKLQEVDDRLSAERERLEPILSERLTYEFDDPTLQLAWRHEKLSELVKGLTTFVWSGSKHSGIVGIHARLDFARSLRRRTVDEHEGDWKACLARVAKNSKYAPGTLTVPQLGLIPLGPDPVTTLEEFCETATGDPPVRDPSTGRLVVTKRMAMVFVLLPGGTFTMGAQAQDPNGPNHDPQAAGDQGPPHEVTLAPFFLSKYEMTQGQWLRSMGVNPSYHHPGFGWGSDLRHPVEQVDWEACQRAVFRLGLRLPAESQWEYGCRAGTGTVWSTGSVVASLAGFANIADEGSQNRFAAGWNFERGFEDGHPFTAAVGSLKPNGFGLHDMHGNVWEWSEDSHGRYPGRPATGDGLRVVPGAQRRVYRGGSFPFLAVFARSAFRNAGGPSYRDIYLGVRAARGITF